MKDMTQEWFDAMDQSQLDKNKNYVLFGEKKRIPDGVFKSMLKMYKMYEMKNIKEITENYELLTKKEKFSFRTMLFMIGLLGKLSRKMKYLKDFRILDEKYGHIQRELYGADTTLKDIIKRKTHNPVNILIADVKLENFKSVKNTLFEAYTFEIVDKSNNRIDAVFVYEEYSSQFFSQRESYLIDRKNAINMARTADAGKTFIIYGYALTENYLSKDFQKKFRGKRLMVRHIQDAGRKNAPDMPFLTIK